MSPTQKVLSSWVGKVIGYTLLVTSMFAVLFDPTEMALGSHYIELSSAGLTLAEMIGNVLWLIGTLYLFITLVMGITLFSEELLLKNVDEAIRTKTLKQYKPKWYILPQTLIYMGCAIVALGSGFWFFGFFWLTSIIIVRLLTVRVRNTTEFKEATESE